MGMVRVQTEQLAVAACVRLQPQNTEDESRGMTQTCTAKSYERSLRSGRAGMVKVGKFSIQIPLLQTGKDEPQCRGTLRNVFGIRTKAFSKSTSQFLHCKNKLVVLTTWWLPWLQTNWRDSGC